ncbi:MAG: CRISPR system precrRNA processing endoribonuclease RAMP protein Cas6 [Rubrobacter sp.]|nr:CRISPR system precrRNA processing endoribonuclease RAMP protein Cas6 [Rubrobacter sp.]
MSSSGPGALTLHCHEVTVRFLDRAVVPPYEGSMIRGAFGRAFKESCCPFPHENGAGCSMGDKCPYAYVFETSPPEDARDFAKNREVPRPYLFEPPEETKMEYGPGERMRFGFTTVGRAADYMPYFVYAFSRMGEAGVGRRKARYELENVVAINPLTGGRERLFEGGTVRNVRLPAVWEDAENVAEGMDGERVGLEFLTPAFVKHKGKVSPEAPSFAALVQNLMIRLPMLSAVHCGEVWRGDFRAMVDRAGEVETIRDGTTWVSFRRYSSFRGKSEPLEGVVGSVEYAGPLAEFLPLLVMGGLAHVGKRAVFGLGRYRLL